jgi:hypothetical protein
MLRYPQDTLRYDGWFAALGLRRALRYGERRSNRQDADVVSRGFARRWKARRCGTRHPDHHPLPRFNQCKEFKKVLATVEYEKGALVSTPPVED